MKHKITDEIKEMLLQAKCWLQSETTYIKLTVAEKLTLLLSALVVGAVCLLIGMIVLGLFSIALVDVFRTFLSPWLAYLCVGGIEILLMIIVVFLRKPLVINPISKFITKLFLDNK